MLSGGRGEFRRMLWRQRGWVYGGLANVAGMVVRRCGVRGDDGTVLTAPGPVVSLDEKVKTRGTVGSTAPADSGGVAVMVLGKPTSFATAGDRGWAVTGVSR